MYAMSVSTGDVKSPNPVDDSYTAAVSYPHVLETWDSNGSEDEDADSVAVVRCKDSTDVIGDNARREEMTADTSWDHRDAEDSVAAIMGKDSEDVVDRPPENKKVLSHKKTNPLCVNFRNFSLKC